MTLTIIAMIVEIGATIVIDKYSPSTEDYRCND
jgi:hypothetical protein